MQFSELLGLIRGRWAAELDRATPDLDGIAESVVLFDMRRIILAANEAAERFYGYGREELVGKSVDVLVPARFRQQDAQPPVATSEVTTVELPALRRDGSEVMTVWSFAALGAPRPFFVMNVRERTQVLADLETSTYATVFESSPVPIALSRVADNTTVIMNQAFADLFELRREDFIGRPTTDLGIATAEQRAEIFRLLAQRGTLRDVECTRRTATGKTIQISLSVTPVRIGNVEHLMSTVQNISEHKATASALAESRARAQYAVRLAGIGFWYCDLPFEELAWDDRVKEHFFLPPDARVTIDTFYERIMSEDRERTRAAIEASIQGNTHYDVNYRTFDPATCNVKWIRAMGGASYAADGTPIRFDGVTVDITNQKTHEEQLTSANRVKDEFLAMLGHELRNPLAPIVTAVQLLKLRRTEARELEIIERQAAHLTRLVDDLLDVSRITRGRVDLDKHPYEIAAIVRDAVETVSTLVASSEHALQLEVPANGLVVEVDRVRMVQVLSNLLTNAAKYTAPRGRIALRAYRERDEVVVRVEDTGDGIAEDLLPHVFDMFVQSRQSLARSQGGLGLGLAIVKSLVALHGGRVSAESAGRGKGSAFEVRLPATTVTIATRKTHAAPHEATGIKRVLVVDDNVDGADMLSDALEMMGHHTAVAHDGHRALAVAAAFVPDIALVDIGLPLIDGYEVARRLRESHPRIEIIAVTGYGQSTDRERSQHAGFVDHLTKPIDLEKLGMLLAAR